MTTAESSEQLSAVVRSVDGVVHVYDVRPAAVAAAADLVAKVVGQPAAAPVTVAAPADGLTVSVSVAVADTHPAGDVCQRILDAVKAHLETVSPGETVGAVKIQVSRIGE